MPLQVMILSIGICGYFFKCFPLTLYLEPESMKRYKEMSIIYIGEVIKKEHKET